MKLFKLSQTKNIGYDVYDAAVVCAEDQAAAIKFHPCSTLTYRWIDDAWRTDRSRTPDLSWAAPDDITCVMIGDAEPNVPVGVVLASFNAG